MEGREERPLAWVLHSLQALQLLALPMGQQPGWRRQSTRQRQPRGVPWSDSEGARGSRSLHLPLGRRAQVPGMGGLPTFYGA